MQLIEGARVCNPKLAPDTPRLAGGVEYDLAGKPLAVHVADRFPYDFGRGPEPAPVWTRVPLFGAQSGRRNVLKIMTPTRANQTRGVPILATVMEALSQLGEYTRAELMAAVVNSCFAMVTKTEGGNLLPETDPQPNAPASDPKKMQINFEPGMILEGLMPSESVDSFTPGRPSAGFDPFYKAMCRNIAVGLGLSTGTLLRHFEASYSASRGELLEVWEIVHRRRAHFAAQLHQPIYEEMLAEAIDARVIAAPGWDDPLYREAWCRAMWIGPAQGQLNPYDEVRAAALRVSANFSTEEEETAKLTGGDWDCNIEQRGREVAKSRELGLASAVTSLGANQDGAQPASAALPAPDNQPPGSDQADQADTETPADKAAA
jgi:lambda family phage portal protein